MQGRSSAPLPPRGEGVAQHAAHIVRETSFFLQREGSRWPSLYVWKKSHCALEGKVGQDLPHEPDLGLTRRPTQRHLTLPWPWQVRLERLAAEAALLQAQVGALAMQDEHQLV